MQFRQMRKLNALDSFVRQIVSGAKFVMKFARNENHELRLSRRTRQARPGPGTETGPQVGCRTSETKGKSYESLQHVVRPESGGGIAAGDAQPGQAVSGPVP